MRERMQEKVTQPRKDRSRSRMILLPGSEAFHQLSPSGLNARPGPPFLESIRFQRNENPFASVLHGGKPRNFASETGAPHVESKLAINVGHGRFEACETELDHDFSKPV